MATTLAQLLDQYVYTVLQDQDNKVRWTRDELTQYVNMAIRDLVVRRPEAGVVTDTNLHLVAGARQTLGNDVVRLREIVCNVTRVVVTPTAQAAVVNSGGTQVTVNFNTVVTA